MRDNRNKIMLIIVIAIITFVLLQFTKYFQNGLSISDFSINKLGNLINLIITISLILPSLIILINKKKILSVNLNSAVILSYVYFAFFLIYILFIIIPIDLPKIYWLGYPIKKILPVIFLLIYQIFQIWVIINLWISVFNPKVSAYFRVSFITLFVCFLFVLLSFLYTFNYTEFNIESEKSKFDTGIVLGAAVWSKDKPSPIFIGRIKKTQELYKNGIIKKIQLTGGNAPGELSEAKAAANYLTQNYFINPNDILIEESTSTTNEQVKFIKENLIGIKNQNNLIIISDDFHLQRVIEIADFYDLSIRVISSDYNLGFEKSFVNRFRDSIGLLLFLFFAV